jgi:hypothetical protein
MTQKQPLYQKALLAWRQELMLQRDSMLKDKQAKLRDRMCQKLEEMFGADYPITIEGAHAKDDLVLGAVVEDLNLLAFRDAQGNINIVLLVLCPRCGHQIAGDPLTRLADLGRELLELDMKGTIGDHECPADRPPLNNTRIQSKEK